MQKNNPLVSVVMNCHNGETYLHNAIESVIDQNAELSISAVLFSPEIYIPIGLFFIILIFAFIIKKLYFKQ